ncbi:aminodeoxychorismate synthase component I [Glaesserella parasuis]|uniref:aminodeoxychorismate synthase component I n=1 Tax=Glaesserella parasuis TaxID=738 RepID=UPI00193C23E0|nr:aminodeoxychorismate synthase component I [Glaesserella parasuis]MCT8548135.1 aminodeoxychorismate synthase component I [Glaesserella parasuis]MCT8736971.1 aminodeoxychorismate synthase component I [Glaesserella parasuis]MCT8817379.1 aminodeoxychorismate synthase component I [Glaesserella parasuis]MDG6252373.1 aminodeoxychorismate synthase component I [Glaesserella parasuis]MDO9744555.1 aminodeoxychorismate synthase component I [Glaesserella parasuis]
MQQFIQIANQYGKMRLPFFFLIDFEKQKPLIYPLSEIEDKGLYFDFNGQQKFIQSLKTNENFELEIIPPNYTQYKKAFDFVQQQIQIGNSYLLNLTQQTKIKTNYHLAQIFQQSKAKYKLLLDENFVCFSPECFIRIKENKIYSYPMKGTINANEEDAVNKLLNSEKEFTEHNTIVDLIRNDLALVSKYIQVTKHRYVEKVVTHRGAIYQTSSEICGELDENWQKNIGTMLDKLLPAGSISGAPKVKTVEIIQQAEQQERGYYTGIFGYFDGENVESAVAIRYIEKQGDKYYFRSGGGITALSQLDDEYNEILEKVYVPISTL